MPSIIDVIGIFPENMADIRAKYKNLFSNKLNAMAYCQIVVNKKEEPVNYIFLEVNKTFERLTGLKKKFILGKKVTDVIPGFDKKEADFIKVCGNVALTGKEITLEQHFEEYKESPEKWYSFFIYRPKKGFFTSISSDITKRKEAEEKLKQLNLELEEKVLDRTRELAKKNKALEESSRRYRELWNEAPIGYHILNTEGIIINVNKTEANMLGYRPEEMVGHSVFDFIEPEQKKKARERFKLKISGLYIDRDENRTYIKKDGSKLYISTNDKIEKDSEGEIIAIRTAMIDVTERKISEESIKRYNREISMLSACNETLVYADSEKELLNKICKIIVEVGGYKLAWVGSVENDERKSVRPIAQVGFEDGYLEKAKISWSNDSPRSKGPTGTAIRTGKFAIGRFASDDRNLSPWRMDALKRGFNSSVALPLKNKKGAFGVLTVYSSDQEAFSEKEISLLLELSEDLAFGLMTLRLRKSHRDSEKILKVSNKLLKLSNKSSAKKEYLDAALKEIKKFAGCGYLGIRMLQEDGTIPFESFIGYSRDFWESENFISTKSDNCACIRVITGKPELQDKEAMTKEGSFYLGNSFKFISNLPAKEKNSFRGKCFSCGFGSFAVVPIRSKGRMIGALHIADKRINSIDADKTKSLESLAVIIGEAIEKFNASEKVLQSEEKYRELIENANSIIVRLDSKGNITFFNEFAEKFFGFKEKNILGKNIVGTIISRVDSFGRNSGDMLEDMIEHPYRYSNYESENVCRNGKRVWVVWNNRPIFNKKGILTGILSVGSDVTDRKQKEERLLESYRHMGVVNRKVSSLLELDKLAHERRGTKKDLMNFVLHSLMNISLADAGAFFIYENEGARKVKLVLSKGIESNKMRKITSIPEDKSKTLGRFFKTCSRLEGYCEEKIADRLCFDERIKYFLLIPIKKENKLKAAVYLGFHSRKDFSNHELEFFDVFSIHSGNALSSRGMLG